MLESLAIFVLALAAFAFAARFFKKAPAGGRKAERSPLDVWVTAEMARLAASKLSLDERSVAAALAGDPDPDTSPRSSAEPARSRCSSNVCPGPSEVTGPT